MKLETVQTGQLAPDFVLSIDGDKTLSLSSMRGKKVILYFYPKDNTPGCTTQACDFMASHTELTSSGAVIIGVSRDSMPSHDNFRKKYGLTFPLVSDSDGKICESYGVWVQKINYGKTYMGIERSTFLVDKNGVVCRIWRKVKVAGHVSEVLAAVKELP